MTRAIECRLCAEWQRSEHRPGRDGPIIRPVWHAPRHVAEEAPVSPMESDIWIVGPVARGNAPKIGAIALKAVRIARGIFPVNGDGVAGVLEVVATLFAHESVLDPAKIEAGMGEKMGKQRPRKKNIGSPQFFPLVG